MRLRNGPAGFSMSTVHQHPGVIGIAAAITLWVILAQLGVVGPTLLAKPTEVVHVLAGSFSGRVPREQNVFVQVGATMTRVLLGWSLSLLAGIALGGLLGLAANVYQGVEPVLEFVRSIPPIMVFPLFLVAFNFGESAYVATIAFGCIPLIALTVTRGFQRMSSERSEILRVFHASMRVRVFAAFMEVLPSCVLAGRLAFSISIIVAVVSEMVFTPRSGIALGSLAKEAEIAFQTPLFFAAVLVIGLFGYLGNYGMRKVEERLGVANGSNRE